MTELILFLLGAANIPFAIYGKYKWFNLFSAFCCGFIWGLAFTY